MPRPQEICALLMYLVIADEQIDQRELLWLQRFAEQRDVSAEEWRAAATILVEDPDPESLQRLVRDLAGRDKRPIQESILRAACDLANSDGFIDQAEVRWVGELGAAWGWGPEQLRALLDNCERPADLMVSEAPASLSRRLVTRARLVWLHTLRVLGRKDLQVEIAETETLLLLSGREYSETITKCAQIAQHDFALAKGPLETAAGALRELNAKMERTVAVMGNADDEEARNLRAALSALRDSLQAEVLAGVTETQRVLVRKERAMSMFTISFLGKTKAGKSTLHATVTGEGFDAIGRGKQRTTRYNRIYTWKNLRIIDTPGIEAPQDGGEVDARIATSTIDESDVICFVVTSDSQQTTELDFLKRIRDRAKPVIILLNVKESLSEPVRLKRFLENPDLWATRTDEKSLAGHVQRIERYARERYAGGPLRVIPVQLLAARLSRQPEHAEHAAVLFRASRLQQFLDAVRVAVVEEGVMRRSQTLLDGARFAIYEAEQRLRAKLGELSEAGRRLDVKQREILSAVNRSYDNHLTDVRSATTAVFREAKESTWDFAYTHYNISESAVRQAWESHLNGLGVRPRLHSAAHKHVDGYLQDVHQYVDEAAADFTLVADHTLGATPIVTADTYSMRSLFRGLGLSLTLMGAAGVLLFSNPVGLMIAGIGGLLSMVAQWFKSAEEKRRKSADKLHQSLLESISKQEGLVSQSVESPIYDAHQRVTKKLEGTFGWLILTVDRLEEQIRTTLDLLAHERSALDKLFAWRAAQFIQRGLNAPSELDRIKLDRAIQSVDRRYGSEMRIYGRINLSEAQRNRLQVILGETVITNKGEKKR